MRGLRGEIQAFGVAFDPTRKAAMLEQWGSLTARLQAVTTDPRIGQLVSALKTRLDQADRNIGEDRGADGRTHVVTCSDPDLRAAGETAMLALQAIRPMPELGDPIVGADTDSSLRRVFVLIGHPLGLTDETVQIQEYVIFFLALVFESLFIFAKANVYSVDFAGPQRGRGISTGTLEPMLSIFNSAWNTDVQHAFRELSNYILNRDSKRVRLGVPETDGRAQAAIEVLVSAGHAEFVERHNADDLEEQYRVRVRIARRGSRSFVDIYDISADTWSACMAATANGAFNGNGEPRGDNLH